MRYLIIFLLFISCKKQDITPVKIINYYSVKFQIEGTGAPFQAQYKNEYGATINTGYPNGLISGWNYEFQAKTGDVLYFKAFKGTSDHLKATIYINNSIVKTGECDGNCEQILVYSLQ